MIQLGKYIQKVRNLPPVKAGSKAIIQDSLVSNGCIIEGTVINSVLSPGVRVGKGSIVKDSVILNDTIIGNDVKITQSIIDKEVIIGGHTEIGFVDDMTPNKEKTRCFTYRYYSC